jgi:hypothetical protein
MPESLKYHQQIQPRSTCCVGTIRIRRACWSSSCTTADPPAKSIETASFDCWADAAVTN